MKSFAMLASAVAFALATAACGQTDAGITTSVKSKFAADALVKAYQINVTTRDHVVSLEGDVESEAAKERAIQLTREASGVRGVDDQLRVRDTAATTGDLDVDHDRDLGDTIEHGAEVTGDAVKRGAEATADAAKKAGRAVRDAVTDKDRDSDNDGK